MRLRVGEANEGGPAEGRYSPTWPGRPATPTAGGVLLVTSIGALLASLTSGTLVIALPDILRDLHTDLFALMWIVVGYTLVVTVLVVNAGRLIIGGSPELLQFAQRERGDGCRAAHQAGRSPRGPG